MELADDCLAGARFLGQCPDGAFIPLISASVSSLSLQEEEQQEYLSQAAKALERDPVALKSAFDAANALLIEAAKANVSGDSLRSFLVEECNFNGVRAEKLSSIFEREKSQLRARLASISSCTLPQVVEVDWRLDYHIKSSSIERVNQLTYLVKLKTRQNVPLSSVGITRDQGEEEDGEEGNGGRSASLADGELQFACTLDQLQDLVAKLKDGVKQMERSGTVA